MSMKRPVTEQDFRQPEFRDANPEDYEFRDGDHKIVRKDRWKTGMFQIAHLCGLDSREGFEIPDVVKFVENLTVDDLSWEDFTPEVYTDFGPDAWLDIKLKCGSVLMRVMYTSNDAGFSWNYSVIHPDNIVSWRDHQPN